MAGYDNGDDVEWYNGYGQETTATTSGGYVFIQFRRQGYGDRPYPHQQADNHLFPSQQGQQRLEHATLNAYDNQAQGIVQLPEPNSFGGGVHTDALYGDRGPSQAYGTQPSLQLSGYQMDRFNHVACPGFTFPQGSSSQVLSPNSAEVDPSEVYRGGMFPMTDNQASSCQSVPPQTSTNAEVLPQGFGFETRFPLYNHSSGLPVDTRFRSGSDSFAPSNTAIYPLPQASNEGYACIKAAGTPTNGRPLPDNPPPDGVYVLSSEPAQVHIDSIHAEPWSPFQPGNVQQEPQYHDVHQLMGRHQTSDTTRSMFSGGNFQSSHMAQVPTTPLSSTSIPSNGNDMRNSLMPVRTHRPPLARSAYEAQSTVYPFQVKLERSATPQIGGRPTLHGHPMSESNLYLTPPMVRKPSSTNSSISDISSPGAPPTDDPEALECEKPGCSASFTGEYRRGNLGRHRRLCHGSSKPYMCQDDTCAKEFKRQDARLKHYRKYHSRLAASSPYVARNSRSRRPSGDPDVDLRYTSSWT